MTTKTLDKPIKETVENNTIDSNRIVFFIMGLDLAISF